MTNVTSAHDVFITGLKNAHAMENQALSIMKPQLSRIEHYPEVAAQLDLHIRETENQMQRLEQILNPGFVALIRKLAAMETEHEALMFLRSKMRRIHTQVNLSRAILADRWLSREWLRP